jgi:hypothetical protein
VRFFFDAGIAITYVDALRTLAKIQQYDLVHLSERFPSDIKDVDWITKLAIEGDWVIISQDPRISRSSVERQAWQESGLTAFFFGDRWANLNFWKQAESLVHWWPQIALQARKTPHATGFLIPLQGKEFKQIYPRGS